MANILVIDDDRKSCILIQHQLEEYGYRIKSALSGKDGLKILQRSDIHLILLDQVMPKMNGLDFFKHLQLQIPNPPPVIMMTAHTTLKLVTDFLKANGTDFIEKGIEPEILHIKIQQALMHRKNYLKQQTEHKIVERKLRKTNLLLADKAQQLEHTIQELAQQAKLQKKQAEELRSSNKELLHFTDIVAHDLKEPLRSIANSLQFLQEDFGDTLEEDAQEYVSFAIEGAQRLNYMIHGLSQYANVNSIKPFTIVDCNELLQSVKNNLKYRILDTEATIIHGDLPTLVGHKYQLLQIFQNLISNAIKFKRDAPPVVTINVEDNHDHYLFSIADNGIGFDESYSERIFEIFHRLHTHREYKGSGIGLSICKKIINRHKGNIWASSEPDKGSTFYFTISKDLIATATIADEELHSL